MTHSPLAPSSRESEASTSASSGPVCARLGSASRIHSASGFSQSIGQESHATTMSVLSAATPSSPSMSSVVDSPARTSRPPARALESPEPARVYGPSLPDLSAIFDPATSSWRTFRFSGKGVSKRSLLTFWRAGMTRSGMAYPLRPLAPLTGATASGSSPTPNYGAMDGWPTPTASVAQLGEHQETWLARRERLKVTANNGNGAGMPLTIAVQLFPTPAARDWKDTGAPTEMRRKSPTLNALHGGQLNPTWVEWLMGFPLGWTDLELSVTP
jgi:DNA (cytosine-5)-methyltransferase 1